MGCAARTGIAAATFGTLEFKRAGQKRLAPQISPGRAVEIVAFQAAVAIGDASDEFEAIGWVGEESFASAGE